MNFDLQRYFKGNRRAKIICSKIETTSRAYATNLISYLNFISYNINLKSTKKNSPLTNNQDVSRRKNKKLF